MLLNTTEGPAKRKGHRKVSQFGCLHTALSALNTCQGTIPQECTYLLFSAGDTYFWMGKISFGAKKAAFIPKSINGQIGPKSISFHIFGDF